jgi:hypothetical protein
VMANKEEIRKERKASRRDEQEKKPGFLAELRERVLLNCV